MRNTKRGPLRFVWLLVGVGILCSVILAAMAGGSSAFWAAGLQVQNRLADPDLDRLSPVATLPPALTQPWKPEILPRFEDVTEMAGVGNPHGIGDAFLVPQTGSFHDRLRRVHMAGGAAWLDYNNNGLLDLYVVNQGPNALYRNNGDGTFTDVAAETGVLSDVAGVGVCVADFNNDGWPDIYVTNEYYANNLFVNNGDGTFTDIAEVAGVGSRFYSTGCAWGDFDNDGWLDLYVTHYLQEQNILYRSNGDSTFTDVTFELGMFDFGYGFQPVWFDYDMDGDIDLYIVNDFGHNVLFRNMLQETGAARFERVTEAANARATGGGMGVAIGDYNNDGWPDLLVTQFEEDTLLRNLGLAPDGSGVVFEDVSEAAGVTNPLIGWGTALIDFNLNGWQDIFSVNGFIMDDTRPFWQPDVFYLNQGDGTFREIGAGLGLDHPGVARGAAFGDFDRDGRVDVYIVQIDQPSRLLRNTTPRRYPWLAVQLQGIVSNRDGIGAKVWVETGQGRQWREIRSGESYLSSNALEAYFGLGEHRGSVDIRVEWPSGIVQELKGVEPNQYVRIVEAAP